MKPATIKALQELCDALMQYLSYPQENMRPKVAQAADRLKRVLDEEPNSEVNQETRKEQ